MHDIHVNHLLTEFFHCFKAFGILSVEGSHGNWQLENQSFNKPMNLVNFDIIIGSSESHQSATDFSTDSRGGKI